MAEGRFTGQALAARRPAAQRCHVGFGPGFINKNQPGRGNRRLEFQPLSPPAGNVRAVLF
jgi:hypothetical protein